METRRGFCAKREAAAARSRSSVGGEFRQLGCPARKRGRQRQIEAVLTFLDVGNGGCLSAAGDGRILGRGVLGRSGVHGVSGLRDWARNHSMRCGGVGGEKRVGVRRADGEIFQRGASVDAEAVVYDLGRGEEEVDSRGGSVALAAFDRLGARHGWRWLAVCAWAGDWTVGEGCRVVSCRYAAGWLASWD